MSSQPTIKELQVKLNEIIDKHNDLAKAVSNLCSAIEAINAVIFMQGDTPEKFDS